MVEKIKKMLLIVLTIVLFSNSKTMALILVENTDGASEEDVHYPCDDISMEGCGYVSQDFTIRVTMIDKDMKIIPGTKTVEFDPLNPYHDNDHYIERATDKDNSQAGYLNYNRTRYNFQGSMVARDSNGQQAFRNLDTVSDTRYKIYLGFAKDKEVKNDFTDYAENRKKFIDFLTSLEKGIYVQDIGKNVDFISFFLKVSGYTDTLANNKGTWTATEIYDIVNKIANNEYYLIIEPVYYYSVYARDLSGTLQYYNAEGTANQLAAFYAGITGGSISLKNLFWPARTDEVIYNHSCNFLDLSEQYAKLAEKVYGKYNANILNGMNSYEFVNYYRNNCSSLQAVKRLSDSEKEKMLYFSGIPAGGFGKNLIDISEMMRQHKPPKSSCKLKVDSCTMDTEGKDIQPNDNFKLQTRLYIEEGKMSDCVYPGTMATEKELNEYIYHVGEGEQQLWCYDDITYDFSQVRNSLNGKTFSKNQLVEMPVGELTVERTCYTELKNNGYLTPVFKNDPGQYQTKFTFEFNNQNLEFVKNSYKYQEPLKEEKECENSEFNINCKYKYTAKIRYHYELKTGTSANNANINIKDLQLYNTVPNTNSIDFIEKRTESKVIKITNDIEEGTITSKLSTQITDGYGLTNKIYNKLKSNSVTKMSGAVVTKDTNETITYYRTSDGTNHNQVSGSLNLDLEENKKEYCNVSSSIIKDQSQTQFRVISLSNPFPARDGTTRLPGENWINRSENNAYYYIQNNRNVNGEEVYNKEPLYKIKLDGSTMIKIREYNKEHSYSDNNITCETGTGRMCLSSFLRDTKYISNLEGTCKTITPKEITEFNRKILEFEKTGCNQYTECMVMRQQTVNELDLNKDGYVTSADLLEADFYACADKTAKSGG